MQDLYLILANGRVFAGKSFGANSEAIGELVFATSMLGGVESLTDPNYFGQMVIQTFPLVGNYGVIPADFESDKSHVRAYIVREWCQEPSNFRSEGILDTFLMENGIVGLCGVDTRALTRVLRQEGTMNAKITANPNVTPEVLAEIAAYRVENAVSQVTCVDKQEIAGAGKKVILLDLGAKNSLVACVKARGWQVVRMPAATAAEDILAENADGLIISGGPGNPADCAEIAAEIAKLLGKMPIMGVGLGHQVLALAAGGKTEKLLHGHRGSNQPVKDMTTGRVYVTAQNHGFVVSELPKDAKMRFVNANDGTCAGLDYPDLGAFSVQFNPDAPAGAQDEEFICGRLARLMDKKEGM